LTGQKGFDFSLPAIAKVLSEQVQFAILGSGERWIVEEITRLSEMNPEKLQFHDGYNEALAHRIEAGSDFFLMPSLYEPCGLNQMYSLRYGTLPIVRAVGGLRDTVWENDTSGGDGTGFVFTEPNADDTLAAIKRGIDCFTNDTASFENRMKLGMRQRFSWESTATQYENIYTKALKTPIN
jgi:starch synthase